MNIPYLIYDETVTSGSIAYPEDEFIIKEFPVYLPLLRLFVSSLRPSYSLHTY